MRHCVHALLTGLIVTWLAPAATFAQGGGTSSTGSINGRVSDASGGVLPGVWACRRR
jgi:hypothetical protein